VQVTCKDFRLVVIPQCVLMLSRLKSDFKQTHFL
jgi:hypothetical protein